MVGRHPVHLGEDVVFTYEYCTNEETGCSVEAFTEVDSVVADDDYTVTITFTSPQPYPYIAVRGVHRA